MDTVEMSLYELDLRFYFVTADGKSHTELKDLSYCFERIAERFDTNENYSYLSEADAIQLAQTQTLTRKTIFLFAEFDGAAFQKLRKTSATILGPRCIIDCFHNEYNIPNVPSPLFNVALRENTVCTSGLKTIEKNDVERLVQYMGGNFLANDLAMNTTYLVTNTTMSIKYEKAVENGIRCVTLDWVHRMWQLSTTEGVVLDASNADKLYAEHRIPHFHKLGITSTGIAQAQRTQLKTLIEANGGIFYGSFKSELINILVACRSQTGSEKFRAAVKCRKLCLTPEWFFDSVTRGYTLPVNDYCVVAPLAEPSVRTKVAAASTPTKTMPVNESAFNADCTNLSDIMGNVTVNESRMSSGGAALGGNRADNSYKAVLANINVQLAKKSGAFLDGCNVFLCGFNGEEKEKLSKILGNACATLFDEYDSRVVYAVCGAPSGTELQLISGLNSRTLVTLKWLVASIEQKSPASERAHLYSLPANRKPSPDDAAAVAAVTASPASKKNMASMSNSFRKPMPRRLQMDDEQVKAQAHAESDLLQQYLVAPIVAEPPPVETPKAAIVPVTAAPVAHLDLTADDTDNVQYFAGLTFIVDGFTTDSEEALVEDIELAGGEIVSPQGGGTVDYVVVPMDIFKLDEVPLRGRHLVNDFWVGDSALAQCCAEIAYYHRPLEWQNEENKPLAGMLLVLTTYSGSERSYLTMVGRIMGADVQDRYIKTQQPVLICPRPEGAKYNGAIKWGLPVVNCEWLLECVRKVQRVPMRPYLVGASVAPNNEPSPDPVVAVDAVAAVFERPADVPRPTVLPADSGTDSLQITAQESPIRPPAPVVEADERRPSVETPESSVERLKRQRPDEFAAPSQTPVLKHRRLSEIASTSRRDSPFGGSQSPQGVDYETSLRNRLACVSTPCRETVFNELLKLKEAETPETKRRLQALSTPDLLRSPIPVEYRTPAREQRMRDIKDMHFLGPLPSPAPITPFAEVQRRFWRNALGDSYVSPSQRPPDTQATVADAPSMLCSQSEFAVDAPAASSTQQQPQVQPPPANAHVKRLSDFIIQHKTNERTPPKPDGAGPSGRALLPPAAVPPPPTQPPPTCAGATEPIDSVGWCDPAEFYEGPRFRQRDTMQYVGTPKFHISCLDAVRLERITAHIVQLGGELCEARGGYDPTCTHVLCEKPSRSEKIFSAIAAGKWLLSLRYVEDSAVEQTFLNEERYEFGNPLSAEQLPDSLTDETGKAAYRWRKQLQAQREQQQPEGRRSGNGVIGAFNSFRVILHTSKKVPFRNLLEAGGGTVLDVTEPYETSKEALTATHCVLDTRNKMSSRDRQALQRAGVACVNIMFLQAFVSSDVAPDPKDHAA